ncbi:MAG: hypothetical protein OXS47_08830 [Chloroflexota bacterium]|nr:hypothetical protein [Chloroflexota bacterium]
MAEDEARDPGDITQVIFGTTVEALRGEIAKAEDEGFEVVSVGESVEVRSTLPGFGKVWLAFIRKANPSDIQPAQEG